MKVQRSHILNQEKEFKFTPSAMDVDIPELCNNADIKLNIYSVGENYFCHGLINGELTLQCDICLSDYFLKIDSKFDVYIKLNNSEELSDHDKSDIIIIEKNDIDIDFLDYVRDLFLLEIPLQKRCKVDCKGLCSTCGGNLNKESCNHENDSFDPRWAVLKELKNKLD
ncbi:MAG: DUF177 domain-containing protein [Candidatus Marinimicrobia bacterium]|nr:DUF177 domain-containing protein [Candidatus Neomarinimicrobiota bacterium]